MTIPKKRESSGTHVPYIVRNAVVGLTLRLTCGGVSTCLNRTAVAVKCSRSLER